MPNTDTGPRSAGEAVSLLADAVRRAPTEEVSLAEAAGRVLARDIETDRPSPSVDVSAMDGFAARMEDLDAHTLPLTGEIRIGQAPPSLTPGTCLRIVTGAPVPAGADVVIKVEDTRLDGSTVLLCTDAMVRIRAGQHIRRQGENAATGTNVIGPGCVVHAGVVAALASFGVTRVRVHRRLRLQAIVTGDELVNADATPSPYELRDSNGPALSGLFGPIPWIELMDRVHAPDDVDGLRRAVENSLDECDVLFLTGGVSMGTRDYVPGVLRDAGAKTLFHRLPQRPGKPVLGAVTKDGQAILGLPGNPLSVMVTARRMGVPLLMTMAGVRQPHAVGAVELREPDDATLGLWWYRLVRLESDGAASLVAGRGSGDVPSAARSDGFVEVPPGASGRGPWPYYGWQV